MMLGSFKAKGNYEGISYTYEGPAHLSIGQEGAAVGVGLALCTGRPHLWQPPQPWRVHRKGPFRHLKFG